jgi:prophage regulatory protein
MSHKQTIVDRASLLRLPGVLALLPVGRSTWWAGVKAGKYPKPIKLGPRTTCWLASEILDLIESAVRAGRERGVNGD